MKNKRKYKCPCCGYFTLSDIGEYDICPVCFWEDDPFQREDENYSSGANRDLNLKQGKLNYIKFGTCDKEMLKYCRKPSKDEANYLDS